MSTYSTQMEPQMEQSRLFGIVPGDLFSPIKQSPSTSPFSTPTPKSPSERAIQRAKANIPLIFSPVAYPRSPIASSPGFDSPLFPTTYEANGTPATPDLSQESEFDAIDSLPLEEQNTVLSKRVSRLRERIKFLMSSLQSKEVAYDLLVEQQETFGQRLDKVKQELKEVSDQKIDIESQLSTKTSDHRELVTIVDELKAKNAALRMEKKILEIDIGKLREAAAAPPATPQDFHRPAENGHANGLSEDFARLSAEKAELEAKVAELASTVSKNKKLKRELKYVKGQLKQAEVTLTASVADRDEALMQLAAQDHINSSMDASFISETLQEEIKEREVLLKENEDLREQLLQAQAQAAAAPAQANEFFGASEDVNPKIEELKELLQQVSDDKEALERKFMHLQEQYTQLEQDMLNDKEALETELNREKQVAQTLRSDMEQMQRAHEEELHRASFHGPDALSPPPPEPQRRDDAVTTELNTLRAELDTAKQVNAKLEQERAELSTKLNADIAAVADEQHAKKLAQVELELQDYKQKAENADVDIEAVQQLRTNFRKAILALDQLKEENSLLAKTSSMGAPRGLKPRAPRRGCFSSLCTLVGYFFTMVTIAAIVLAGVYGEDVFTAAIATFDVIAS